jgi:hypothetical protein
MTDCICAGKEGSKFCILSSSNDYRFAATGDILLRFSNSSRLGSFNVAHLANAGAKGEFNLDGARGRTIAGARHAWLGDSSDLVLAGEAQFKHCRRASVSAILIAFRKAKMTIN